MQVSSQSEPINGINLQIRSDSKIIIKRLIDGHVDAWTTNEQCPFSIAGDNKKNNLPNFCPDMSY